MWKCSVTIRGEYDARIATLSRCDICGCSKLIVVLRARPPPIIVLVRLLVRKKEGAARERPPPPAPSFLVDMRPAPGLLAASPKPDMLRRICSDVLMKDG